MDRAVRRLLSQPLRARLLGDLRVGSGCQSLRTTCPLLGLLMGLWRPWVWRHSGVSFLLGLRAAGEGLSQPEGADRNTSPKALLHSGSGPPTSTSGF